MLLQEIVEGDARPSVLCVASNFLEQSVGGVAFGLIAGFIVFRMLKGIDDYHVEILLTLALAMGAYALADPLPVSAPIAVVSAGILIGNPGRTLAMSKTTRDNLDSFWELLDEILNVVLFVLIGLEMLVVPFSRSLVSAGLSAIPVVILARWISVAGVIALFRIRRPIVAGSTLILTWAGLRGGISVALALSLAEGGGRDLLLTMTYAVVVFSITAQGLSVGWLTRHLLPQRG
jgi:CPA1 family monovalent cation:H+ antiporter